MNAVLINEARDLDTASVWKVRDQPVVVYVAVYSAGIPRFNRVDYVHSVFVRSAYLDRFFASNLLLYVFIVGFPSFFAYF